MTGPIENLLISYESVPVEDTEPVFVIAQQAVFDMVQNHISVCFASIVI